jgi:hypothetical protein
VTQEWAILHLDGKFLCLTLPTSGDLRRQGLYVQLWLAREHIVGTYNGHVSRLERLATWKQSK